MAILTPHTNRAIGSINSRAYFAKFLKWGRMLVRNLRSRVHMLLGFTIKVRILWSIRWLCKGTQFEVRMCLEWHSCVPSLVSNGVYYTLQCSYKHILCLTLCLQGTCGTHGNGCQSGHKIRLYSSNRKRSKSSSTPLTTINKFHKWKWTPTTLYNYV